MANADASRRRGYNEGNGLEDSPGKGKDAENHEDE